jgi:hypothetical protein
MRSDSLPLVWAAGEGLLSVCNNIGLYVMKRSIHGDSIKDATMYRLFLITMVCVWSICSLVGTAEDHDAEFSADKRRAALRFAVEMANEATIEEVERIYRSVLSQFGECCGGRSAVSQEQEPIGILRHEFDEDLIDEIMDVLENSQEFNDNLNTLDALQQSRPGDIFMGTPVPATELNYVVYVQSSCCSCTGTLVGPNVVITAEHCLRDPRGRPVEVREVRIGTTARSTERYRVKSRHPHPHADLAVLILEDAVPSSVAVPCPIAEKKDVDDAQWARAAGFGLTEQNLRGTKMMVDLAFAAKQPNAQLGNRVNEFVLVGRGGKDTCEGDSGGPVLVQVGQQWRLAGVTSRAIAGSGTTAVGGGSVACGFGGIYVRADSYSGFIHRTATDNGGQIGPGISPPPSSSVQEALDLLKSALSKLEAALN